jgi:hypothetical protein
VDVVGFRAVVVERHVVVCFLNTHTHNNNNNNNNNTVFNQLALRNIKRQQRVRAIR